MPLNKLKFEKKNKNLNFLVSTSIAGKPKKEDDD
jgi:hypothetical protein